MPTTDGRAGGWMWKTDNEMLNSNLKMRCVVLIIIIIVCVFCIAVRCSKKQMEWRVKNPESKIHWTSIERMEWKQRNHTVHGKLLADSVLNFVFLLKLILLRGMFWELSFVVVKRAIRSYLKQNEHFYTSRRSGLFNFPSLFSSLSYSHFEFSSLDSLCIFYLSLSVSYCCFFFFFSFLSYLLTRHKNWTLNSSNHR